ncbi:amidohydrolase family protein [Kitasatospora sp. KL5]|uniref:amidohydrolase family protein n=1 Tax=Kitasatospora sp. KL5 TaxID=3425125 RepID=UPI003D6E3A6C
MLSAGRDHGRGKGVAAVLDGLDAALVRELQRDGGEPWMPGETLDLATALRGYTLGSAYAVHLEDRLGSLTPGRHADLVMLSGDLFAVEPEAYPDTRVELGVLGGEVVHRAG